MFPTFGCACDFAEGGVGNGNPAAELRKIGSCGTRGNVIKGRPSRSGDAGVRGDSARFGAAGGQPESGARHPTTDDENNPDCCFRSGEHRHAGIDGLLSPAS